MRGFFAFPLVRLALIVAAFAAVLAIVLAVQGGRHTAWGSIAATSAVAAVLLGVIVFVERMTTGRTPAAIGFDPRHAGRDLALGAGLGALMFSLVVLELALGGHYRVTGIHATWDLAIAVLLFGTGAVFEELLFRGALFRLVEEWAGTWIALAVSGLLFGAAHAFNPGATWVSVIAIALEAGVLLGSAFAVTKNLWLPIGLHFAWNFFEGPVYGTQVSGRTLLPSLLTAHLTGPAWLTGGAFGPEAGIPAVATSLIVSAALLAYASRHALIVSPFSSTLAPRVTGRS